MIESVLLTWVENWPRKLDVPKMPWALRYPLTTCLTLEVPVRRTHARVIQATDFKFMSGFVHDFRMLDLSN